MPAATCNRTMQRTPCVLDFTHPYHSRHLKNHPLNLSSHPSGLFLMGWWQRTFFPSKWKIKSNKGYFEGLPKTGWKNFYVPGTQAALLSLKGIGTTMERYTEAVTMYHMSHVEMATTVTLGNICEQFQGLVLHKFHWHKCGPALPMWQYYNWDSQLEIKPWQSTGPDLT